MCIRCIALYIYIFRITEIWDYPKYGCPDRNGDKYYYYHNTGLQNQRYVINVF